ncbi:leucine-rich colipase-like protein 1 isoform X4 [Eleutherodactylus coqui]|uniref:leucine-rich colipase-like protein 1 isoform X4 n=1 Tax=Eleutherodactylus coqui TaxID=57060 RepID=UPI003462E012
MAQHRIMTILLFVYLSLCFEVAQSELKKDGDPCIYSDDCKNRCCHRDSPKGSGKCVQKSMRGVRCYGPNYGDPCFRSHQCNSGCCYPGSSVYKAFCVPKYDKTRKCLGPNFGDFCYSSDQCHSGCCHNLETIGNVPICLTKSEDHCFGAMTSNIPQPAPPMEELRCTSFNIRGLNTPRKRLLVDSIVTARVRVDFYVKRVHRETQPIQ